MSLVISIKAVDGILLAADTRGTTGDPRGLTAISDIYKKIFRASDYCGIGAAGSSELASSLLDNIEEKIAYDDHVYVDDVLNFVRNEIRTTYNQWFENIPISDRQVVVFILVGYRKNQSDQLEPMIYTK